MATRVQILDQAGWSVIIYIISWALVNNFSFRFLWPKNAFSKIINFSEYFSLNAIWFLRFNLWKSQFLQEDELPLLDHLLKAELEYSGQNLWYRPGYRPWVSVERSVTAWHCTPVNSVGLIIGGIYKCCIESTVVLQLHMLLPLSSSCNGSLILLQVRCTFFFLNRRSLVFGTCAVRGR